MATYTSNYAWTKPAGSDPVDIGVLNNNLDSQDGIMHDAFLNMADPFSESSTYAVGAIVLYGTKTYKCHTAVTTAGSWTGAANWDEHKISALVLDNAPTDGSNNPVKSDGIYDSEKDIYAVMGETGAKNLIPLPYYYQKENGNPWTSSWGVTYTVDNEGAVTLNGTSSNTGLGYRLIGGSDLASKDLLLPIKPNTKYIITGAPSDAGSGADYIARLYYTVYSADTVTSIQQGVVALDGTQIITSNTAGYIRIVIDVKKNATYNNLTFKPMLRLASDTDDTYQPYAKTNKQLTDDVSSILTEQDSIETELDTKADKTATASGETLALVPTSEGRALLHTAYGMSVQNGTPTPSSPVDIVSAKANFTITHGQDSATVTTDLTLRAIEVTSSDAYNLVRDNKYYIADTLDYTEDDGFVVTRRIKESVIDGSQSITTSFDGHTMTANGLYTASECISFLSPNNRFKAIDGDSANLADANSKLSDGECIKRNTKNSIAASDYFKNTSMTSASTWTTWLTSNPITVYDILVTPTTENITTAQALALLGLKTYDESTTISSQAEPSCTIAVEYAKERLGALALTAYNTAKGNDLRIKALES